MIKKFGKVLIVSLISVYCFIVSIEPAIAHPGRTDSDGGHYCRTNCPSWGLEYNEYHFHDSKRPLPVVNEPSAPKTNYPISDDSFDWLGSGFFALGGGFVTYLIMKPKKKL
jgi:hypothetical protein